MNKNELQLLEFLDNQNYKEAIDLVFREKDFNHNERIEFLSLIGKDNLLNLFTEREKYLANLNSKKKIKSYSKYPILAKFSEEFNLLEDMFVDKSLHKAGMSSVDDLLDKMSNSSSDGIFPFLDGYDKQSKFIIPNKNTYNTVINFINIKSEQWNGVERRLKPRL